MADSETIAQAYVQIMPSTQGIKAKMEELLGKEMPSGEPAGNKWAQTFGNGLKTLSKISAAAVGAAAAGISVMAKQALDSYADYEQLVGGVETLFKDSADTVQQYAANAFQTAGLSANQYMETVTSFSASLLQSLGGDTAAAAQVADMAITDMADNANKMGSSMESIQNAYQGFAKQNYTMLDNLKLGYGGTQSEMYRLLQDAAKLDEEFARTAVFSLDEKGHLEAGYADIAKAIHIVQTEMGITGTTAKEASETISGSLAMLKSSFDNLLAGFANENADMDRLIQDVVDSALTAGKNLLPAVENILEGAATFIERAAPMIADKLPGLVEKLLPPLMNAAAQIIASLVAALPSLAEPLLIAVLSAVDTMGDAIAEKFPAFAAIFENLIPIMSGVAAGFVAMKTASLAMSLAANHAAIAQAALNLVMSLNPITVIITLVAGLAAALITLWKTNEGFRNAVIGIFNDISKRFRSLYEGAVNVFESVGQFFQNLISNAATWGSDLITNFINGILSRFGALRETVSGLANTVRNFIGFSEPEEGPLSNFHTYAPDMMDLFMQGIREGEAPLKRQLQETFDFSGLLIPQEIQPAGALSSGAAPAQRTTWLNAPINITLPVMLGGGEVGRVIYQLYNDEANRVGVRLIEGGRA